LDAVNVWVRDAEQETIGQLLGQLRRNMWHQTIGGGDTNPTMLRRQWRLELWRLVWLVVFDVRVGDAETDTIGLLLRQLRRNMRDQSISGGNAEPTMLHRQWQLELWQLDWLDAVRVRVGDAEQDTIGLLLRQLRRNMWHPAIGGGDAESIVLRRQRPVELQRLE